MMAGFSIEAIVLQCLLSWRQVVRQLVASTSSNSVRKDHFSSESGKHISDTVL